MHDVDDSGRFRSLAATPANPAVPAYRKGAPNVVVIVLDDLGFAQLGCYGSDLDTFERELKQACQNIGVEVQELSDLITDQQMIKQGMGIEIAPDTPSEL